jgi:hypothetical protein
MLYSDEINGKMIINEEQMMTWKVFGREIFRYSNPKRILNTEDRL